MKSTILLLLVPLLTSSQSVECEACKGTVDFLNLAITENEGKILDFASPIAVLICQIVNPKYVCDGYISLYREIVLHTLTKKYIDPEHFCFKLHSCSKPKFVEADFEDYKDSLLKGMSKPKNLPKPGSETFKFLFTSDIHFDPLYKFDSEAKCMEPLCCREGSGVWQPAGYWGSRAVCDIPLRTVEAFMKQASKLDLDFVIWAGDDLPQDMWQYEPDSAINAATVLTDLFLKYFNNTTVYPVQGNHDYFPLGQYNPGEQQDFLSQFAKVWSVWLSPDATLSYGEHGYYSMKHPNRPLRTVVLNTQNADVMNFYLWANATNPDDMLGWLQRELEDAEKAGDKVLIVGHIPPGNDSFENEWARRHQVLTTRFQETIRGQFYGHVHSDQVNLVQSLLKRQKTPAGVQYTAPALTTYQNHNPSFRVYEMDEKTLQIVNYYQYRLKLDEANKKTSVEPEWELYYSAKEYYGIKDLSPESWDLVVEKILQDQGFAQLVKGNYESQYPDEVERCDEDCAKYLYCHMKFSVYEDVVACGGKQSSGEYTNYLLGMMDEPWEYKEE